MNPRWLKLQGTARSTRKSFRDLDLWSKAYLGAERMKMERIYSAIRPLLRHTGLLKLVYNVLSPQTRARIAQYTGLGSYIAPLSPRAPYRGKVRADGVNYIADMRADIGVGESTRAIYAALQAAQIPVNYQEIVTPLTSRQHPLPDHYTSPNLYGITLAHINPPEMRIGTQTYPEAFEKCYTIGYWLWEVPRFPQRWLSRLEVLDEVWTASRYTQRILAQIAHIPVLHMPIPITVPTSGLTRRDFNLPEDRPIFFFAFNPGSSVARKNPYAVIEAYRRAFAGRLNPPCLVIKAHHLKDPAHRKIAEPLRAAVRQCGGILLEDHLTREQMNDLLAACDCFVSLHRAEGFGLIMAEAMALGKPVIATAYSSNTEFMTPSNSFRVGYTLRPITPEDHRDQPLLGALYQPGQLWAEPDIDHAADLMRYVVDHPDQARHRGTVARQDMAAHWNVQVLGARIAARLAYLAEQRLS
jgi:glycosyltransferase involved in cell wall biosynthesis